MALRLRKLLGLKPKPPPRSSSSIQKHLFEDGSGLRNAFGERFSTKVTTSRGGIYRIRIQSMERNGPSLAFNIALAAYPQSNRVRVVKLAREKEPGKDSYRRPPEADRGYGIGRFMLHHAIRIAREHGITRITITPSCRGVRKYYKSLGFRKQKTKKDGFRPGELVYSLS